MSFFDLVSKNLAYHNESVRKYTDSLSNIILEHSKIILIGTGKSYHVAVLVSKIANSFGLRWIHMDSSHALHGDIGIIAKRDLIIYLSASGESEEILKVAKYLQDIISVGIVCSHHECKLSKYCKWLIDFPIKSELSLFEKAPMLSSILMTAFLYNVVNEVALRRSDKTLYLSTHPAGYIGKSI